MSSARVSAGRDSEARFLLRRPGRRKRVIIEFDSTTCSPARACGAPAGRGFRHRCARRRIERCARRLARQGCCRILARNTSAKGPMDGWLWVRRRPPGSANQLGDHRCDCEGMGHAHRGSRSSPTRERVPSGRCSSPRSCVPRQRCSCCLAPARRARRARGRATTSSTKGPASQPPRSQARPRSHRPGPRPDSVVSARS
jgi:hypothetical protein